MRSLVLGVGLGLLASSIFVGGFATGAILDRSRSQTTTSDRNLNDFLAAYRLVTQRSYYRPFNRHQLIYAAIDGMLSATGDPHTIFLSPNANRSAGREINGAQYAGIGAIVTPSRGTLRITVPLPGSPAQHAGVRAGDSVIRIDGHPTSGMSPDAAIARIHGRVGTSVRLTVVRGHQRPITLTVRRADIPPVTAYGRALGRHLTYIQVFSFGDNTAREVSQALRSAVSGRTRGIVLDLRGNPGGYVDQAQQIVSRFVDRGVVAYEKTGNGSLQPLTVLSGKRLTSVPVAVLVDAGTASAAEITAAALRDDDHAVIIGTRTYGKGSMQSVYTLGDGSSVRITDRLWLTPRKQSIQQVGITPTIVAQSVVSGNVQDHQLAVAEHFLLTHAAR